MSFTELSCIITLIQGIQSGPRRSCPSYKHLTQKGCGQPLDSRRNKKGNPKKHRLIAPYGMASPASSSSLPCPEEGQTRGSGLGVFCPKKAQSLQPHGLNFVRSSGLFLRSLEAVKAFSAFWSKRVSDLRFTHIVASVPTLNCSNTH